MKLFKIIRYGGRIELLKKIRDKKKKKNKREDFRKEKKIITFEIGKTVQMASTVNRIKI